MSFVLVVVAAITLVIGLFQSGLGIIVVSIACSLLAGIVLVIAVVRGRPEPKAAGAPARQPGQPAEVPTAASSEAGSPPPPPPPAPVEREPVLVGAGAAAGERADRTEVLESVETGEPVGVTDTFPIHDYDRLRATEILPMLRDLSDEQLEAVREHEQAGKGRFMILSRIDDEKQSREAAGGGDADDESWGEVAGQDELVTSPTPAGSAAFPIPDYDELKALEVLGRLPDLDVAELRMVRQREERGGRRAMVLNRIDRLMEEAPPESETLVVPPPPPPSRRRATKPRSPAAKALATKVPGARKRSAEAAAEKAPAAKAPLRAKATQKKATPVRSTAAKRVEARSSRAAAGPAPKKAPAAQRAVVAKRAVFAPAPKKAPARKVAGRAPTTKASAKRAAKRR
ncbi:MAG: hypothetical protein ACR2HY_10050 [Acidimicrobiales bacterium]